MRRVATILSAAILAACAKKDSAPAADSTGASMNQPAALNLADLAGKWQVEVAGETSDSTLLTYEMAASADPAGWTITLPGREPMAFKTVTADGDSVVLENGPYQSALRPGVQVSTRSVIRMRGDIMLGRTTAHYAVGTADSVVLLRTRGRRAQ